MQGPSLTVVIPMYNEEDNVDALLQAIATARQHYKGDWHTLFINDGSTDATAKKLDAGITRYGSDYEHIELQRNFGQTAAMQAGIDLAQSDLIVTMDGDLQNDPMDIPRLINEFISRDLDLLQGWRKHRQDKHTRTLPSRLANTLIQRVSGVKLDDYGCSLKVYRADVIKQIRLYGEMHRFIPVWIATVSPPHRIGQSIVTHHPRSHGRSKYGIGRTFRVLIDLLSMFFFLKYRARPGHFFGSIGLFLGSIGFLCLSYLAIVKYGLGMNIGTRPLLLIASLLIIASLQFFTTGILSEIMSRIFFQTTNMPSYKIRQPLSKKHKHKKHSHTHPNNAMKTQNDTTCID